MTSPRSPASVTPVGGGTPPGVAVGSTTVGPGALAKAAVSLGVGRIRQGSDFDPGGAVCAWARAILKHDRTAGLDVTAPGLRVHVVGDRTESEEVLGRAPDAGGSAGKPKIDAMRFLAPQALTIADGEAWTRLRAFNEGVVDAGRTHRYAQTFLDHVRRAFARSPKSSDDIRHGMGQAMTHIVLGKAAAVTPGIADDIATLFGVVQSPVKRKVLGFRYKKMRDQLYMALGRAWDGAMADDHSLIALAKGQATANTAQDTLLQQVPHWMFTFTGSGTDLLTRTLVMITSRPAVRREVLDEAANAGPADQVQTIDALLYLNACLLETGRLFPPVTKTFHAGGHGSIAHYFPLLQRDDRLGHTVHGFRPNRWLSQPLDAPAAASNLFLRGPRACPGMDLILFVCRAALVRMIAEQRTSARMERLTSDPLPVSFPSDDPRFTVAET